MSTDWPLYARMLKERFGPHARAVPVHHYHPDGGVPPDHRGEVPCTCGLPESNVIHQVPVVDDEVAAAEARRLGEGEQ